MMTICDLKMDKFVRHYRMLKSNIKSFWFHAKHNLIFIEMYISVFSLFSITTISNQKSHTRKRLNPLNAIIRHKIVLLIETICILYALFNLFYETDCDMFDHLGDGGKLFYTPFEHI